MARMISITIVYSGRVQGVGFRATVRSIAQELGVAGTVRNNHNGTVTVDAMGTQDQIDLLRQRIRDAGVGRIDGEDASECGAPVHTGSFEIVRE